jgi:hypothetical protein
LQDNIKTQVGAGTGRASPLVGVIEDSKMFAGAMSFRISFVLDCANHWSARSAGQGRLTVFALFNAGIEVQ